MDRATMPPLTLRDRLERNRAHSAVLSQSAAATEKEQISKSLVSQTRDEFYQGARTHQRKNRPPATPLASASLPVEGSSVAPDSKRQRRTPASSKLQPQGSIDAFASSVVLPPSWVPTGDGMKHELGTAGKDSEIPVLSRQATKGRRVCDCDDMSDDDDVPRKEDVASPESNGFTQARELGFDTGKLEDVVNGIRKHRLKRLKKVSETRGATSLFECRQDQFENETTLTENIEAERGSCYPSFPDSLYCLYDKGSVNGYPSVNSISDESLLSICLPEQGPSYQSFPDSPSPNCEKANSLNEKGSEVDGYPSVNLKSEESLPSIRLSDADMFHDASASSQQSDMPQEAVSPDHLADRHKNLLMELLAILQSCSNVADVADIADSMKARLQEQDQRSVDQGLASPKVQMQEWLGSLKCLERRERLKVKSAKVFSDAASPGHLLHQAREVGSGVRRALQASFAGIPHMTASARTLKDELICFAAAAASEAGRPGLSLLPDRSPHTTVLTPQEVKEAASDMWSRFGGVERYADYITMASAVPHASVPLCGGAAWKRLLIELEVAIMLALPDDEDMERVRVCCAYSDWRSGADVAQNLMYQVAYPSLLLRLRYVTARLIHQFKLQFDTAMTWMQESRKAPFLSSQTGAGLAADVVQESDALNNLVLRAFETAISKTSRRFLSNLEHLLKAGCQSPHLAMRFGMQASAEFWKAAAAAESNSKSSDHAHQAKLNRSRVIEEMRKPKIELSSQSLLVHGFSKMKAILTTQAVAFADTSLVAFCDREVDEALSAMVYSDEEWHSVNADYNELEAASQQVASGLLAIQQSMVLLQAELEKNY